MTGEFDLFGDPVASPDARKPVVRRYAMREDRKLAATVQRLAATGMTRQAIAREVGISEASLYANYFPEIGARRGAPGRRAHAPTEIHRRAVTALARAGATNRRIAEVIGISQPTLRKHYRDEIDQGGSRDT